MEFFESLSQGFAALGTWPIVLSLLVGSALGIVVGVLPGVGPGVTIAVLLPFTLDGKRLDVRLSPPRLGEHSLEILTALGYSSEQALALARGEATDSHAKASH